MNQQDKERLRELAEKADAENTNAAWTRLDNYVTPRLILALLEENEKLVKSLSQMRWAASELDEGNRIRQFDEYEDEALALLAEHKGG